MITITGPGGTIEVDQVAGYEARRRSGTRVHELIADVEPAVTVGPGKLRRGRLELWCATHADALALDTLHAAAGTFALDTGTDTPGASMTYVVDDGDVEVVPASPYTDPRRWVVRVPFAEVLP